MSRNHFSPDKIEDYESLFDPMRTDRQARRKRKPKVNHTPKKSQNEVIDEIADTTALESGFDTTYKPSRHEEGWLIESLKSFYDMGLITDILSQVKGGKEANVYRCEAHPTTGKDYIAAKVYRPRIFRSIRNDQMYRQGRSMLDIEGKEVRAHDQRAFRAVDAGSAYGTLLQHTSWLMYEYSTMQKLYKAGGAVPEAIGASENAILMSYHGDPYMAAPTLNSVSLDPDEAEPLFWEVMRNIELMLDFNLIHGDLSAYNILYWEGKVTIIDFPQVVYSQVNNESLFVLRRDVTRICDYFSSQGVDCDSERVVQNLWRRYLDIGEKNREADLSRLEETDEEEFYD